MRGFLSAEDLAFGRKGAFKAQQKGPQMRAFSFEFGSPTRTRTRDKLINSQSLYQLSYRGIVLLFSGAEFSGKAPGKSSNPHTFRCNRVALFLTHYALNTGDGFFQYFHAGREGQAHVARRAKGRPGTSATSASFSQSAEKSVSFAQPFAAMASDTSGKA